jgi:tetratricopeptide (TPR) repeat protein
MKEPMTRRSLWRLPAPLSHLTLVAGVALACYLQTASYQFVYDDSVQVALNPRIRSFSNLGPAFTENFWAFAGTNSFTNYYRPLQAAAYMAGYALGGLSPAAYHWINIMLHVCASLAVFWIGLEFMGNASIALWGALLFAAHPMHTESVAWIAGITDVGCGLFYFVALAAYLRYRRSDEGKRLRPARKHPEVWLGVSLVSFFLALLYKEMALMLPAALFLMDYACDVKGKRLASISRVKRLVPFVIVLIIYVLLRINALGAFARTVLPLPMTLWDRLVTMAYLVGRYLQDLVIPLTHNAFHVFRPFSSLGIREWCLPLVLLLAGAVLTGIIWRLERKLGVLAALFGITLVPVLNLGGIGQNIYAERYLYIPSLGFCLLAAGLIHRYLNASKTSLFLQSGIVLLFSALTLQHNPTWRNEKTFYEATLAVSPQAMPIRNNFGKILFEEKNLGAAERQFASALDAYSTTYVKSSREAATSLLGLSAVASAENRLDDAWKYAEMASRLTPDWGEPYQTLGMLSAKRKNYAEAGKLLRFALQHEPGNAVAHVNLGSVLFNTGEPSAAEKEFRTAIELDPKLAGARLALALLLSRTSRIPEALLRLREALTLDPSNPQALELLQRLTSHYPASN